jgi:hypothetical protein
MTTRSIKSYNINSGLKKSSASDKKAVSIPLGYGQYGFNSNMTNSGTTGGLTASNGISYNTSIYKFGSAALNFNGTSTYASFNIPAGATTHTVAFWIYPRANSERSYIVDFRTVDATNVGYWLYDTPNTATFGGDSEYTFTFPPILNTWTHWALVTDAAAGTMTWYQDGARVASASRICVTSSSGDFTLGTYSGVRGNNQSQYFLDAVIDNLYVSATALTQAQIQELYNRTESF